MIRRATVSDAAAIAPVHLRGRRSGYAAFLPPEFLDAPPEVAAWQERLAGPFRTLVWDQDGVVAGFVSFGPCEAVDREPEGTGIVMALYVDPPAQGAGVGTALLDAALESMRAEGLSSAVLWVFRENERARRFYARHGWVEEPESEQPHAELGALELRCRVAL